MNRSIAIVPTSTRPPAGSATTGARCTVGLLTWNAGLDGARCLERLAAQTEPHLGLCWVDNASTDDTVANLQASLSWLPRPQVNATNEGFCAGHNAMLATCPTPYYLALNQDALLEPDYIARLCDWLDEDPRLAMASGLLLRQGRDGAADAEIHSAGMALGRNGFSYKVAEGLPLAHPATAGLAERRRVPTVEGAALLLRVEACRSVSPSPAEVFPPAFFAYCEETDLALRLFRAGWDCGVDGQARAWHEGQGSGGRRLDAIEAHFIANHWLLRLRQLGWGEMLLDAPWTVACLLRQWLPRYLTRPRPVALALAKLLREAPAARRAFHGFHPPPSQPGLATKRRTWRAFDRFSREQMHLHHQLRQKVDLAV